MAPLSHFHYLLFKQFLLCFLFLSLFFASSFSFPVSSPQIQSPQIPFGRRTLLKTIPLLEDNEDEESLALLPKKKKPVTVVDNDDDEDDNKKLSTFKNQKQKQKNKLSNDEEDDGVLTKKKKKSSSYNNEEDDDIVVTKKKKKSSSYNNEEENDDDHKKKKSSMEDETKPIKPKPTSPKNQTKLTIKPITNLSSTKNKTKLTKTTNPTTKDISEDLMPKKIKKLNSTSSSTKKSSLDQPKPSKLDNSNKPKQNTSNNTKNQQQKQTKKQKNPLSLYQEDDENEDLVAEFRDLPTKFQETFVPDLQKISTTSKAYLTKANKEITKGFKPYVGNKYAPSLATLISFASIIIPLVIVSFLFRHIQAHFSLQRLLIFIQIYLAIYFFILCLSSLITGLEPLRFLYATSQSTYVCVQLLQTLGYVLYLLLLIMYLILVLSTESGPVHKLLGLAQTFAGLAVGLHYYMTVVHRVVLRQPPKTSWKVHGLYATCFFVICLSARMERRKKAYIGETGQQGKKN